MFKVAEKFEECTKLSEIDVHLQFWDNMTGRVILVFSATVYLTKHRQARAAGNWQKKICNNMYLLKSQA